jgi:two-component system, LuxR family, response regulator FixJ
MPVERTVYVLDDDQAVLRSLERLLSSANYEPITFDRPDLFLTAAKTFKTGCVLLDVRLPGMSGLEVLAQLNRMRSDLSVIIVTAQGDIKTAVRAMKAGASDFLEKPYSDDVLLRSIEVALEKEQRTPRDRDIADAVRRIGILSPREKEVLDGLMAGRPNKLIAYQLGISVRTVEVHRARMMERLGARQLAEVIRLGVMARLGATPLTDKS